MEGVKDRKIKIVLKNGYNIYVTQPNIHKVKLKIHINKSKYTGFIEKLILNMYQNFYDTDKVVLYLNKKYNLCLTKQAIIAYASKKKIKKKYLNRYSSSFVSRDDEKDIIKFYRNGKSTIEIAKMYGYKNRKSILDKLNKYDEKRRKSYQRQQEAKTYKKFSFEKLDSQEKAYIIGLLITDGYVMENRSYFGIDLTDEDAIRFMSEYTNASYTTIPPKGKGKLNHHRIIMYGKKYMKQLKRFGIIGKKTFITMGCELYENEEKYVPFILRGIIDGDGWVRKDGKEFFISTASLEFGKWCKKIMNDIGFVNIKVRFIPNNYNGIYLIRTGVRKNLELLRNKVYDKPFGMSRKFNRLHKRDAQRL